MFHLRLKQQTDLTLNNAPSFSIKLLQVKLFASLLHIK
jgi:hypothetical protein